MTVSIRLDAQRLVFWTSTRLNASCPNASAYLDIQIFVDLDHVAEQEYVLHQTRELPHVTQPRQYRLLFGGDYVDGLEQEV